MDQQNPSKSSDQTIIRIWSASIVVLTALSWKLWIPGFTDFPRVPVFDVLSDSVYTGIHYAGTLLLLAGLAGVCFSEKLRSSAGVIAAAFGILFLCNQHCLQPWAWQAFIIAVLIAFFSMRDAKVWIARILISIYLYSAIGKFDYQFIHSLGQDFLNVVLSWVGQADSVSEQLKSKLVLLFPIGELLIAIGLLIPQTRKVAAWLAIVFHVVLIALLSPIGLNNCWPVLVWNAVSALLVGWLFLMPPIGNLSPSKRSGALAEIGTMFAIIILAGPLFRPVEAWDHWLAWGLYSPSNSRVEVFVSDSSRDQCGEDVQEYFSETDKQFGSSRFLFERWSLDELGVPIYPQARFQKAAAIEWLGQKELLGQVILIHYTPSHPVSGEREKTVIPSES